MKTEGKETGISEMAISIDTDSEVIEGVKNGEIDTIVLSINEGNQGLILETIDGHLILSTEEMPTTYHGCYYYNGGEFPYILKDTLQFLVLADGENTCLTHIISKKTVAGTRFRFQGPDKPSIEDPQGDSCIWKIHFEILPVPDEPKKYLMRWNPTISSFRKQDYKECVEYMENGKFRINWSIYEWEEARRGDMFYMLRTGDDKAGIAFNGYFLSDPYTGEDWAGTKKRRCYVDMVCQNAVEPEDVPFISLEKLKEAIPEYNWEKGHSGELLPEEVCEKLDELWSGNE